MRPWALLLLGLLSAEVSAVNAACRDLGVDYLVLPVSEIRALARSCEGTKLADLYYRRAYHMELLARNSPRVGSLIVYGGRRSSLEDYRLYIALLEDMAPIWFPDPDQRIEFLRGEYDHRGDIIELRLRGLDRLADRLEKERPSMVR